MVWWVIARAAFRKNLAYVLAHMANNAGSLLFGLIYMALWHVASREETLGPFHGRELVSYIAASQALLWISTFLPSGLGIDLQVRSGSVALEMARPVPYVPRMVAAGIGEAFYNLVFRSGPLIVAFTVMGVFPWGHVRSEEALGGDIAAVLLALWMGVLMQYLVGIAAFWTMESRWALRLFLGLNMFMSGQLLPLQLMPPRLQESLNWLPFQALVSLPASVWLGVATQDAWISAGIWAVGLYVIAVLITHRATRRLEVQGG